jgi:hypothetical protein
MFEAMFTLLKTFRDMSTLKQAVLIVTIVCDGCARSKNVNSRWLRFICENFVISIMIARCNYVNLPNVTPEAMRVTCCVAVGGAAVL